MGALGGSPPNETQGLPLGHRLAQAELGSQCDNKAGHRATWSHMLWVRTANSQGPGRTPNKKTGETKTPRSFLKQAKCVKKRDSSILAFGKHAKTRHGENVVRASRPLVRDGFLQHWWFVMAFYSISGSRRLFTAALSFGTDSTGHFRLCARQASFATDSTRLFGKVVKMTHKWTWRTPSGLGQNAHLGFMTCIFACFCSFG